MHDLGTQQRFDPFPPTTFEGDGEHRRAANRALVLSALGLGLTGGIELVIALVSGSVGLLSDSIHNLADVSTSLVAFVGFRVSRRRREHLASLRLRASRRPGRTGCGTRHLGYRGLCRLRERP